MTAGDVILDWVVPIAGGLMAVAMFSTPMPAVLRARRDQDLGELNPLPFPAILFNCIGWVVYSLVIDNYLIYWPNEAGLILGIFYTFSCYGLADLQTRERQLWVVQGLGFLISLVGAITTFCHLEGRALQWTWGFVANFILLVYYSAPLSTMVRVVRRKNSASLHLPMALMNVANGSLWTAYGIAIDDLFVAVPNAIGVGFALLVILLIWVYPAKGPRGRTLQPLAAVSMRRKPATSGLLVQRILGSFGFRQGPTTEHDGGTAANGAAAGAAEPGGAGSSGPATPSEGTPPADVEKQALARGVVQLTVSPEPEQRPAAAQQRQQQQQSDGG